MNRRSREIETLALTMIAAVPLYFTFVIGKGPLLLFHSLMGATLLRVAMGKGPEVIPAKVMRVLAFAYIIFYVIDAAAISRSAIAASTHLILFIATYQPTEALRRNNLAQRLLTTALIFIASLATSTHISIVLFVILFGFLMFRQMIYVSHMETVRSIEQQYAMAPASRAAGFYLIGATLIGALMFPLLPRLRNPLVQGFAGALQNATTGLSDTIDFTESRSSNPDPSVVARVWMSRQALPFFTPLRLRGAVYDTVESSRWLQTRDTFREIRPRNGFYRLAVPVGFARTARVQQQIGRRSRLYLPNNTYAASGLTNVYEGPTRGTFLSFTQRDEVVTYEVSMARAIEPLRSERVTVPAYPLTPPITELARSIAGNANTTTEKARAVEAYLLRNYSYVQRPEDIGIRTMSVDDFLLRVRKGHCEYFAAGMVALLSALDVPSRIVGGFYGGRLNPLGGYIVVRREDAHAWVDVWDGRKWETYDPTPAALRPGTGETSGIGAYANAVSDSINYFWDRYVLTYGLGDQVNFFVEVFVRTRSAMAAMRARAGVLGNAALSPEALVLYTMILGAGLLAVLVLLRKRSAFALLEQELRRRGIEVGATMTLEEAVVGHPDLKPLVDLYEEEQFSARVDPARRKLLRTKLAELRAT